MIYLSLALLSLSLVSSPAFAGGNETQNKSTKNNAASMSFSSPRNTSRISSATRRVSALRTHIIDCNTSSCQYHTFAFRKYLEGRLINLEETLTSIDKLRANYLSTFNSFRMCRICDEDIILMPKEVLEKLRELEDKLECRCWWQVRQKSISLRTAQLSK